MQWLGFTGSGLVAIALAGGWARRWCSAFMGQVAERLGGWIDGFIESRREKREIARRPGGGPEAAREREEW